VKKNLTNKSLRSRVAGGTTLSAIKEAWANVIDAAHEYGIPAPVLDFDLFLITDPVTGQASVIALKLSDNVGGVPGRAGLDRLESMGKVGAPQIELMHEHGKGTSYIYAQFIKSKLEKLSEKCHFATILAPDRNSANVFVTDYWTNPAGDDRWTPTATMDKEEAEQHLSQLCGSGAPQPLQGLTYWWKDPYLPEFTLEDKTETKKFKTSVKSAMNKLLQSVCSNTPFYDEFLGATSAAAESYGWDPIESIEFRGTVYLDGEQIYCEGTIDAHKEGAGVYPVRDPQNPAAYEIGQPPSSSRKLGAYKCGPFVKIDDSGARARLIYGESLAADLSRTTELAKEKKLDCAMLEKQWEENAKVFNTINDLLRGGKIHRKSYLLPIMVNGFVIAHENIFSRKDIDLLADLREEDPAQLYRLNRAVQYLDVRTTKGSTHFPTCGHKIELGSPIPADIINRVLETFGEDASENEYVKHVKSVRSNKEVTVDEVKDVHPAFQECVRKMQDGDKWSFEVQPGASVNGKHLLWGDGGTPSVDALHPTRGYVELKTGHLDWGGTIDQFLRYGIPIIEENKHDFTFVSETVESGLQGKIDSIVALMGAKRKIRVITYETFDPFVCNYISMKLMNEKEIVFPRKSKKKK